MQVENSLKAQKTLSTQGLWTLFWSFFKIGFFTFGGGLAMLPFIQNEFINKKRWISQEEMTEMVSLSQSFPGVIAVNISIITGHKLAGQKGAIAAAIGTVLPAFISIVLILGFLSGFEEYPIVQMIFTGIKAASAALILDTVIRMTRKAIKDWFCWIIAILSLLIVISDFSAAWSVLLGATAGIYFKIIQNKRKA
ncbi:MAG: chromate transporter [Marinilabiliaceae bacterium]|nr:chromate transporter [Marinilabiliaceae bacterium]